MERIADLWDVASAEVQPLLDGLLEAIASRLDLALDLDLTEPLFDDGDVVSYGAGAGYRLTLVRLGVDRRGAVVESGALEDPVQHAYFTHLPIGWVQSDAYGGVL